MSNFNKKMISVNKWSNHYLDCIILLASLCYFVALPLKGVIALRNLALVIGVLSSVIWLYKAKANIKSLEFLPVWCFLAVPIWMIILYWFNPVAPIAQFNELSGTWARATGSLVLGSTLGLLYKKQKKIRIFFIFSLLILPTLFFVSFLLVANDLNDIFSNEFILFFKSKVGATYFMLPSIILIFSSAHFYKNNNIKYNYLGVYQNPFISYILSIIFIAICMIDILLIKSSTGYILFILCMLIYYFLITKRYKKESLSRNIVYKAIPMIIMLFLAIYAVYKIDQNYSSSKLTNLHQDVNFILFHDKTSAWKWDEIYKEVYPPLNTLSNTPVNASTYERLSWFIEGVDILQGNMLGLGLTQNAFSFYMQKRYPGSRATKTHSGWLDFAIGAGVVGLVFIWSALLIIFIRLSCIIKNKKNNTAIYSFSWWSILLIFIIWWVAELSEREYFEQLFLWVSFLNAATSIRILVNDP